MKNLGGLKFVLGIEVARSSKGIFLSQRKYVVDLLVETETEFRDMAKGLCELVWLRELVEEIGYSSRPTMRPLQILLQRVLPPRAHSNILQARARFHLPNGSITSYCSGKSFYLTSQLLAIMVRTRFQSLNMLGATTTYKGTHPQAVFLQWINFILLECFILHSFSDSNNHSFRHNKANIIIKIQVESAAIIKIQPSAESSTESFPAELVAAADAKSECYSQTPPPFAMSFAPSTQPQLPQSIVFSWLYLTYSSVSTMPVKQFAAAASIHSETPTTSNGSVYSDHISSSSSPPNLVQSGSSSSSYALQQTQQIFVTPNS
ncbi:hypothetical protein NC652_008108 [Populus alba x Populus x berolinensis]|nr:hypothetical protein NC652_008108 [Populus alba x Populus x berolinensis]